MFAEDSSVVPNGKTDREYMIFQQTIVLPLGRVLYPYDCMKKFEKLNEEKLKICKRKTDLWKNLKNLEKGRNLDFKSGFCT